MRKNIDLSEKTKLGLSILAAENNMLLKPYIEQVLDNHVKEEKPNI